PPPHRHAARHRPARRAAAGRAHPGRGELRARMAALDAAAAPAAAHLRLTRPSSALLRLVLALAARAALALVFAPVTLWRLGFLCPAVLMWLWQDASPREAARLGFWFTFATFVCGTYWLYFSVHILGHAPIWLAFFLMLGLAAIMGLYHAG